MTPIALYQDWLRAEALLIDSDGCSRVSGYQVECCWEHDVTFWHGTDPREAYVRWCVHGDRERAWREASAIEFEEANRRFRKCHFSRTVLKYASPVAWWRYYGVMKGARAAWDTHRARPAEAA